MSNTVQLVALEESSNKYFSQLEEMQDKYFYSGKTRSSEFRIEQLKKLKNSLESHAEEIYHSLQLDLGKSKREAYITEISTINGEINYFLKNLKKLTQRRRVATPIFLQPANSYIFPEALGRVLIISPWNFPYLLSIIPLIGAIAGGNCSILKPSEVSTHASNVLKTIIDECFPSESFNIARYL